MAFFTPINTPPNPKQWPTQIHRDWVLNPPTSGQAHRMAGKSPVSSVVGVLALLVLGGLILYGVQALSRSANGGPLARSAAAAPAGTGTDLCRLAMAADPSAIQSAIKSGAEVNRTSTDAEGGRLGMTPLMIACMDGNAACVKALLDGGAKTEMRTDDGRTALMFAAGWGDPARVQTLLDAGARVDARTTDGRTALMWAAHRGENASLTALLGAGADVNATNKWRQTALSAAARSGSVEKLTALLDAGANASAVDQRGEGPLYAAASIDSPAPVLELLIQRGAAVDAADVDGVTPLMKAAERGDAAHVALLLKAGASAAAKDRINGWTARDWAAKRDDERGREVIRVLETGSNP